MIDHANVSWPPGTHVSPWMPNLYYSQLISSRSEIVRATYIKTCCHMVEVFQTFASILSSQQVSSQAQHNTSRRFVTRRLLLMPLVSSTLLATCFSAKCLNVITLEVLFVSKTMSVFGMDCKPVIGLIEIHVHLMFGNIFVLFHR